ncbi:hypothetical protein ACIBKY_51050 [Nonomuraea sp. NPDC050394]|uniref:hypothetical protein n=1 Tax=Nonomuraea sp. NPDC050394 TaxID=3364363 RepID=UPI0037962878
MNDRAELERRAASDPVLRKLLDDVGLGDKPLTYAAAVLWLLDHPGALIEVGDGVWRVRREERPVGGRVVGRGPEGMRFRALASTSDRLDAALAPHIAVADTLEEAAAYLLDEKLNPRIDVVEDTPLHAPRRAPVEPWNQYEVAVLGQTPAGRDWSMVCWAPNRADAETIAALYLQRRDVVFEAAQVWHRGVVLTHLVRDVTKEPEEDGDGR